MAVIAVLILFICLIIHELAHSLTARYFGVSVRRITLFFLGGVAQTEQRARTAKAEFLIAIAGPALNIILAGMFWGVLLIANFSNNLLLVCMFNYLVLVNIVLTVFNLLPGYPLDGRRVLKSVIWGISGDELKATKWATLAGKGIAIALVISGMLYLGIWIAFIGFILLMFGGGEYQQMVKEHNTRVINKILKTSKVTDAMGKAPFKADTLECIGEGIDPEACCHMDTSLAEAKQKLKQYSAIFVFNSDYKIIGGLTMTHIENYVHYQNFLKRE